MVTRRLIAPGVAIVLLLAAAIPVAAHSPMRPHNGYAVTVLVSGPPDPDGDPDLVNAWGLARSPTSPWWVADNGTDLSTLYKANGDKQGLRVAIPGTTTNSGSPTGAVYNPGAAAGDFHGDPFLFDSEAGLITGWHSGLTTAEVGNHDFADNAVFKGLAIGTADVSDGAAQYLYATDFHNRTIDVFDKTFAAKAWPGAFVDPKLPKGYAPFGIQNLKGLLFVTYAKTQPGSDDERAGHGLGVVDVFLTDGTFFGRVATRGALNAPWGLAWAPAHFGRFSNDLLVGNFGDGKLHAYRWDGHGWHKDGVLEGANHKPIVVDGLWGIGFGSGGASPALANNGPANTLFFTAGPNDEDGGAFGTITVATP
jgi:uncharacterized protein (TIGR03118 family)